MLTGTAGNDMFVANLSGNNNTFNSGDTLNGGAGNDTLNATIVNTTVAQTLTTSSIETVIIQAQARATDTSDNNMEITSEVQVDAARMAGVTNWVNSNSRADLVIEDVRIADNQITKDITITMRETDPGHVDYGVYFDQNSLRNESSSTSQINLQVMDTLSVVNGTAPLLNSPYGGFRFTATDAAGVATVVTLQSQAIDDAQTYAELQAAFQAAADAQFGAGVATVTVGSNFTVTDTTTGTQVTGQEIVIQANGAFTFTTPAGSGWIANGVVPANSGLHTNFNQNSTSSTALVTSTIVLDDVGRGSTGGDLVVGGLSVGDTSASLGVQRFEITVEDNSTLQTINSTNNSLREVTIANGTTTRLNDAYTTTVANAGNLTVRGSVNNLNGGADTTDMNVALPGTEGDLGGHNVFGFSDVRLIDGSAMAGRLNFTAELTQNVVDKYMTRTDTANAPAADNVTFDYKGGANNDTMEFTISDANLAAAGTTTREDFVLSITGGAGNDNIQTTIDITDVTEATHWYANSKLNANMSIDAGDGNDTVRTLGAGDFRINLGAGDDTAYTDNTGTDDTAANSGKAVWVFNTTANDDANIDGTEDREFTNIQSDANDAYALYGSTVTVTFKGLTSTVTMTDAYRYSDLQINQKIKAAINNDATLNKLIIAEDGPANSLIVRSLIDGQMAVGDLGVAITAPTTLTMSAAQIAEFNTANSLTTTTTPAAATTAAEVVTIVTAARAAFNTAADYTSEFAVEANNNVAEVQTFTLSGVAAAATNTVFTINGEALSVASSAGDDAVALASALVTLLNASANTTTDDFTWSNAGGTSATITATAKIPGVDLPENTVVATTANGYATTAVTTTVDGRWLEIDGAASTATGDNTVTVGTGNDVVVLSTNTTSSETVVIAADNGNNTVVNFTNGLIGAGNPGDVLDFTGTYAGTFANQFGTSIIGGATNLANGAQALYDFDAFTAITGVTYANMTTANLLAMLNADVDADATGTAAQTQTMLILIAESGTANDNVFKAYQVTSAGNSADFATATLLGQVNLADTAITGLTDANIA